VLGLRYERTKRSRTQTDLIIRTGLRQTLISAIEIGRINPTPAELKTLAEALGLACPDLLVMQVPDFEETPFVQSEVR
jgi:transcriptional regulator with XRE-family HTH domain